MAAWEWVQTSRGCNNGQCWCHSTAYVSLKIAVMEEKEGLSYAIDAYANDQCVVVRGYLILLLSVCVALICEDCKCAPLYSNWQRITGSVWLYGNPGRFFYNMKCFYDI